MRYIPFVALVLLFGGCRRYFPVAYLPQGTLEQPFQPGTANIPVFIIAGQSNAVGQGQNDPSTPPVPGMNWEGTDFNRGIGPAFAREYLARTGRPQLLMIQCAVGGTSVDQWQPGGTLFGQCLDFYSVALQQNPLYQVAGVLFWQGEAETSGGNAPWASEFSNVVRGFRAQFGKNLPVVFAQLDPYGTPTAGWKYIMDQQASVNLTFVSMVPTSDVQMFGPDHVHVLAPGLVLIGERMEQAYQGILLD